MSAVVLLVVLATVSNVLAQTEGTIAIISLDKATARPFSRLVITGSGFQPDSAEIAVALLPSTGNGSTPNANIGATVIPVHTATATRLEIMVPALVDADTAALTSGQVGVQVVQTTATSVMTSNVMLGLGVSAVPPVPSGVKPGAVTRAYIQAGLNVLAGVRSDLASNADMAPLLAALQADQTDLANAVGMILNKQDLALNRPTKDGNPFTLDAQTLAISDQLIAAYLEQAVPLLEGQAPPLSRRDVMTAGATPCPAPLGNAFLDDFICRKQRLDQERGRKASEAWQFGARLEMELTLGILGNWTGAALSGAGVLAARTANGLQMLWAATTPYLTNYATLAPPPALSKPLQNVGTELLDQLVFRGVPITSSAVNALDAYKGAAKLASGGETLSERGLVVSSSSLREQSGSRAATVLRRGDPTSTPCVLRTAECVTVNDVSVPSGQTTVPLESATLPPLTAAQFDGTYTGSMSFTVRVSAGGQEASETFSDPISFRVVNGVMEGTAGVISPEGGLQFSWTVADITCTMGGRFVITPQTRRVLANGGIFCTGPDVVGTGTWSAVR